MQQTKCALALCLGWLVAIYVTPLGEDGAGWLACAWAGQGGSRGGSERGSGGDGKGSGGGKDPGGKGSSAGGKSGSAGGKASGGKDPGAGKSGSAGDAVGGAIGRTAGGTAGGPSSRDTSLSKNSSTPASSSGTALRGEVTHGAKLTTRATDRDIFPSRATTQRSIASRTIGDASRDTSRGSSASRTSTPTGSPSGQPIPSATAQQGTDLIATTNENAPPMPVHPRSFNPTTSSPRSYARAAEVVLGEPIREAFGQLDNQLGFLEVRVAVAGRPITLGPSPDEEASINARINNSSFVPWREGTLTEPRADNFAEDQWISDLKQYDSYTQTLRPDGYTVPRPVRHALPFPARR